MQTRRDQLQAYRFVTTRVQSALLHGEPDAAETPMRRIGVAMFSSIMIAVVAVVGFGIFGLIKPGDKNGYQAQGQLIIEKETGTRFVWDPVNGVLHPMLNYASAVLYLKAHPTVKSYSQKSLAGVPRGVPYGIPGAPDSLPGTNKLVTGPWVVCSTPPATDNGGPSVTVAVGQPVQDPRAFGDDDGQALLVRVGQDQWLIWHNTKLSIRTPSVVSTALGYNNTDPEPVGSGWLNTVRNGGELAPIQVPGLGQPAPYTVDGQQIRLGQVLQSGPDYYLAVQQGLGAITETDKALLMADNVVTQKVLNQRELIQVSQAGVAGTTRVTLSDRSFLPPTPPKPVNSEVTGDPEVVCSSYTDAGGASTGVQVSLAAVAPGAPIAGVSGLNSSVSVPPGTAALVRLLPQDGIKSRSVYLVTDQGGKFGIPDSVSAAGADGQSADISSQNVVSWLGYEGVEPVALPQDILNLIPEGPNLDASANQTSPVGAGNIPLPTTTGG